MRRSPWFYLGFSLLGCGGLACLGVVSLMVAVAPHAKLGNEMGTCMSRISMSAQALTAYAADNDDNLPYAPDWADRTSAYRSDPDALQCQTLRKGEYGYAMNSRLSQASLKAGSHPDRAVLLFESAARTKSSVGDPRKDLDKPHHGKRNAFALLDGHVEFRPNNLR